MRFNLSSIFSLSPWTRSLPALNSRQCQLVPPPQKIQNTPSPETELTLECSSRSPSPEHDVVSQTQMPRPPCHADRSTCFKLRLESNRPWPIIRPKRSLPLSYHALRHPRSRCNRHEGILKPQQPQSLKKARFHQVSLGNTSPSTSILTQNVPVQHHSPLPSQGSHERTWG